jgi:type IV secretion system protein VirB4
MPLLKRDSALRELTAAERIPYHAHVSPTIVRTQFGDCLQAFRLGGISFETRDDANLSNWRERLNSL